MVLYIHDSKELVGDYLGFKQGINDSPLYFFKKTANK
jgi:hypothetical protein